MAGGIRAVRISPGKILALSRRQASLFLGAAVLACVVLAGAMGLIAYLRALQIQEGERGAANLSYVLSDETDRSLQSVSIVVSGVVGKIEDLGISTPESLKTAARGANLRETLRDQIARDPLLDNLFIVGSDGAIADPAYVGLEAPPSAVLHDFLGAVRRLDAGAAYVSTPFQSGETGTWLVSLSRRISARDGAGLVSMKSRLSLSRLSRALIVG